MAPASLAATARRSRVAAARSGSPARRSRPSFSRSETASGKNAEEWAVVGTIVKVVGMKGLVRVLHNTDYPERFTSGAEFMAENRAGERRNLVIVEARPFSPHRPIEVRFEGFDLADTAKELVGLRLMIPLSERVPPPPDTFYPDELKGMQILSPSGVQEGTVVQLVTEVPSPYLVVATERLGEVMIPFRQVFISEVDSTARVIRLREPIEHHHIGS